MYNKETIFSAETPTLHREDGSDQLLCFFSLMHEAKLTGKPLAPFIAAAASVRVYLTHRDPIGNITAAWAEKEKEEKKRDRGGWSLLQRGRKHVAHLG